MILSLGNKIPRMERPRGERYDVSGNDLDAETVFLWRYVSDYGTKALESDAGDKRPM